VTMFRLDPKLKRCQSTRLDAWREAQSSPGNQRQRVLQMAQGLSGDRQEPSEAVYCVELFQRVNKRPFDTVRWLPLAVYCVRRSMDTSRILTVRALPLLSTSRWMTDPGPDAETVLRNWFQRRTGLPFSFLITSPDRSPL